jgi:hypothetical protein
MMKIMPQVHVSRCCFAATNRQAVGLALLMTWGACGCSAAGSGDRGESVVETEHLDPLTKFTTIGSADDEAFYTPTIGEYAEAACDAGRSIFLMTDQEVLLRFDPDKLALDEIGRIDCPTNSSVNSMAVDRQGNAWLGYHSGEVFRVSIATLACAPSGYTAAQLGWTWFGMAFATDTIEGDRETLYLADGMSFTGLGAVGREDLRLRPIGAFQAPIAGRRCELSGRGDGRLFVFCPGSPAQLVEVDKQSGATLSASALPFADIESFAFAHWGGSFLLFTSLGQGSRVDSFHLGVGTRRLVEHLDFEIVGAGVSTCAPTWTSPR